MIFNENRLQGIRKEVVEVVQAISQRAEIELNRNITVAEGYRTNAVQAAYYAQGREPLSKVNQLRKAAGLLPISQAQNNIITYAPAGTSAHNVYAAADIYLLSADNKSLENNSTWLQKFYNIIHEEVLKRKDTIVWGGHWQGFKDYPHIEYKHYRSLISEPNQSHEQENHTWLVIGAALLLGFVLLS